MAVQIAVMVRVDSGARRRSITRCRTASGGELTSGAGKCSQPGSSHMHDAQIFCMQAPGVLRWASTFPHQGRDLCPPSVSKDSFLLNGVLDLSLPSPLPPVITSPSAADYSPTTQLTHPRSPQYTIQSRPNPHKSKLPVYLHCRPVTLSQLLSPWQLPTHQRQMSMTQRRV